MDLSNLSAKELARFDKICLEFESQLRGGQTAEVADYCQRIDDQFADLLRSELLEIEREIRAEDSVSPPFGFATSGGVSLQDAATPVGGNTPTFNMVFDDAALARPTSSLTGSPVDRHAADEESGGGFDEASVDTAAQDDCETLDGPFPDALSDLSGRSPTGLIEIPSLARLDGRPSSPTPQPGARLGPYRLNYILGRGGMGVVYRATDTRLDRDVAIKVLTVRGTKKQELNDRFEREARSVAALSHPNIVELFDVGVSGTTPFAVMEYISGPTLASYLDKNQLSTEEVRDFGAQIASALDTAHAAGVIHRDLKPQNVMLVADASESQRVKLLDFGLSRELRDPSLGDSSRDSPTREGVILGTPGYMAPEQARGETATSAADIFGLGCILFEAFYLDPAITGDTVADRFAATLASSPHGDSKRSQDDPELAELINECLAANAQDRPSAAEVFERLGRGLAGAGLDTTNYYRRNFLAAMVGGAAGLFGIGYLASSPSTAPMDLTSIGSLAVIPFRDFTADESANLASLNSRPLRNRTMSAGEQIAATLVNELSRVEELKVRPFAPLHAETHKDYQRIGQELEVDAVIGGSIQASSTDEDKIEVAMMIVDVQSGNQVWSETFSRSTTDYMFHQSSLAGSIAQAIGQHLLPVSEMKTPPDAACYNCMVDGQSRSCGDCPIGLVKALKCFEQARRADPDSPMPLAAIVITSLILAAQSDEKDAINLVDQAVKRINDIRDSHYELDQVKLALGMLNWQAKRNYSGAEPLLKDLAARYPFNWQYQHQYGLLLSVYGQDYEAQRLLSEAALLHKQSGLVRTDAARLKWFVGDTEAAIIDAELARKTLKVNQLPAGLLVDIFEDQNEFGKAAAALGVDEPEITRDDYFQLRAGTLSGVPYGPFGSVLNEQILRSRMGETIDGRRLAEFANGPFPMFPLVLARHPAFVAARSLPEAASYLPSQTESAGVSV